MWADAESLGLSWPSLSAGIITENGEKQWQSAKTIFPISPPGTAAWHVAGHFPGCLPALGKLDQMLLQKHVLQ